MVSPIRRLNNNMMGNLRGNYDPGIIEASGALGRSTSAEYRNMIPFGSEASYIGEAMWKGLPNGFPVTKNVLINQRNRFMEANTAATPLNFLPLLPQIDDSVVSIRSARVG